MLKAAAEILELLSAPQWTCRAACLSVAMSGVLVASAPAHAAQCKLGKIVEFPITMDGLRPLLSAKINDSDVRFIVDSGAFYSMVSPASAAELKLKVSPAPYGLTVTGVHGAAEVSIATAKTFTLEGVSFHDVDFLAGGSAIGQGNVGLLGQNVLHIADAEYDLGQGVVRLIKPQDCSGTALAYWSGASTPYSVINLESEAAIDTGNSAASRITTQKVQLSHTISYAYVNGAKIRVLFDTGAGTSVLSLEAAARAGIKPDSPGVVRAGTSFGLGRDSYETYIAPFSSFKIGDEEIRNTHLRIGNIQIPHIDMLLGPDFFLSHRIYVANSQQKLYFTYNGGAVFNLSTGNRPGGGSATEASPQGSADAATDDAGEYARRGAALASRLEFEQALAALTRACELAPENSDYFYQRGMVYWQTKQGTSAIADFDQALKLKANDLRTLLARAEVLLAQGERDRAAADIDAADAMAPKEADERLPMALVYQRADRLAPALTQLDLWIASHADDARVPHALNARCRIRALEGAQLPLALKDCNAALARADQSSSFYAQVSDSRGLVYLRMGAYDRSIADYDVALKSDPKMAWSWYGRGIDKLRKQQAAAGNADIAQAAAVAPQIADEFHRRGIDQ